MDAPPDERPFVASSTKLRLDAAELAAAAPWLGAEPLTARPLPRDRLGLVLSRAGPRLHVPGQPPLVWHPGMTARRLEHGAADTLVRALGPRPGDRVLDATLGLGHDALVLAAAGATVEALERVPLVLWFTLCGLHARFPGEARRVHARRAEHGAFIRALPPAAYDLVYLDPMFPPAAGGPSPTWRGLRPAIADDRPDPALLAAALRAARRAVALKLAPGEAPPVLPGGPPAQLVASKRMRFAVWRR